MSFLSKMRYWFQFGLPRGQAMFVVGFLDLMIALSRIFETYALYFYEGSGRQPLTEFSHHLDYMEYIQLGLESSKVLLTFVLWIGGLLYGVKSILRVWMYTSLLLEVILQLLIWTVKYHLLLTDVEAVPIIKLTYSGLLRLIIRLYLITCVYCFMKPKIIPVTNTTTTSTNASTIEAPNESSQSPVVTNGLQPQGHGDPKTLDEFEILPVGLGISKILKFYYLDIRRIVGLLVTVDFAWGLCRLLENEISQALFGQQIKTFPSSTLSTPVWAEERMIRIFRMSVDIVFLNNMRHEQPPLQSCLIIPKIVEICVSLGILIFLRIVEYDSFPLVVFTLYYVLFILDILFRISIFALCYKIYGDFLCQKHRTAVTNARSRVQGLISK